MFEYHKIAFKIYMVVLAFLQDVEDFLQIDVLRISCALALPGNGIQVGVVCQKTTRKVKKSEAFGGRLFGAFEKGGTILFLKGGCATLMT